MEGILKHRLEWETFELNRLELHSDTCDVVLNGVDYILMGPQIGSYEAEIISIR